MFVDACNDGYVICINCQAFNNFEPMQEIKNYDDFLNSKCELVILIDDGKLIEIYFKENNQNLILDALKKYNISYQVKTIENDKRKQFLIFDFD